MLLKNFIRVLIFLFAGISMFAENYAPPGEKIPVASDNITFELSFDGESVTADLSGGLSEKVNLLGNLKFTEGISGKALQCGKNGAKIIYSSEKNLDFSRSGAVTFWFYPENWDSGENDPRCFFFGVECNKGFIGLQVGNGPKGYFPYDRKINLRFLYFKDIPDTTLQLPPPGKTANNKWHLLCFAWTPDRIYMSLDGNKFSSKKLGAKMRKEMFPLKAFSVGSNLHHCYRLDELRIYNRKLHEKEIQAIWNSHKIKR